MGCLFGKGLGELWNPGGEVVGLELGGVLSGEGGPGEEEDGEVVRGEGLKCLRKGEEAVIEHELDAGRDFERIIFEPSGSANRDGGIEDEEAAILDGGIFEVLGCPRFRKEFGAGGFELREDGLGAGLLEGGEDFRGDLASEEAGCKLENG